MLKRISEEFKDDARKVDDDKFDYLKSIYRLS